MRFQTSICIFEAKPVSFSSIYGMIFPPDKAERKMYVKYKGMRKSLSIALVIIAVVILTASSSFYRVGQGEEALVITLGRVTDTKGPGLYWKIPLIQSIISESVTTIHTKEYGIAPRRLVLQVLRLSTPTWTMKALC